GVPGGGIGGAIVEDFYRVVIARRKAQIAGEVPDKLADDVGGGHDYLSIAAVSTNPVAYAKPNESRIIRDPLLPRVRMSSPRGVPRGPVCSAISCDASQRAS